MVHLLQGALVGAGLSLVPTLALAEAPEAARFAYTVPAIGTAAEYSNGATMTVIDANESGIMVIEETHPEYGRTVIHYYYGLGRRSLHWDDEAGIPQAALRAFDEAVFQQVWPLTPGYSTSYSMLELDTDGSEEAVAASLQVLETRQATTALGDVPVAIVRLNYDVDGEPERRNTYDFWFADGLVLPVRIEMVLDADGEAIEDTLEMTRITYPE